jgi:hypothetical protein
MPRLFELGVDMESGGGYLGERGRTKNVLLEEQVDPGLVGFSGTRAILNAGGDAEREVGILASGSTDSDRLCFIRKTKDAAGQALWRVWPEREAARPLGEIPHRLAGATDPRQLAGHDTLPWLWGQQHKSRLKVAIPHEFTTGLAGRAGSRCRRASRNPGPQSRRSEFQNIASAWLIVDAVHPVWSCQNER